ncbi:sensor histidine kinase [Propioniciclava tarda]|uniref:sensor histidine kinase n=1 Tax=Propioniciclava tarda TaxID=433330 RepID=UPI0013F15429|nr:histidine kinase [Propioniciclava tarda]
MTAEAWVCLALAVVAGATAAFVALRWRVDRRALALASAARASAIDAQHRTAELAVAAERIRIVREMHDVLAHSLAIMIAQADGGSFVTANADASKRAFVTIAETGRAALTDTRRILGLLRSGEDAPDLAPMPDDASTDALVDRARAAGLAASVVRVGQPRNLPAGTRMALFRICQEALTNTFKHAGAGARVIVAEDWRDDQVVLTITNEGGSSPAPADDPMGGHGLGLIGMRERAEIVGGRFTAGPSEGGFRVQAVLPITSKEGDV